MDNKFLYIVITLICFTNQIYALDKSIGLNSAALTIKDPEHILAEQVTILTNFIDATKNMLENQKILLQQLLDYQIAQDTYYKNADNNENLYNMVKKGHQLNQSIKHNHLTQIFDPEFISDLNVFSQVGQKKVIPKP